MIEIERSFAAETIRDVDIRLDRGDLSVLAGATDQVQVRARLRGVHEEALAIEVSEGTLRLHDRPVAGGSGRVVDLYLAVPGGEDRPIQAQLGKGNARIEHADGAHRLELGKGDAHVTGGRGELTVDTGRGDIHVDARTGALLANAGKGDVRVGNLLGALSVNCGSGDVHLRNWSSVAANGNQEDSRVAVGSGDVSLRDCQSPGLWVSTGRGDCALNQVTITRLKVDTAKGDIRLAGDPGGGRWQATTTKGDLSVQLPAGASARVEAATRRGTIHSHLPQVRVGRPGPASRQGGGRTIGLLGEEPRADVHLETVIGDIHVAAAASPPMPAPPPPAVEAAEAPAALTAPGTDQPEPPASGATTMSILQSLARNEITVEEADALLQSLA